MGENRSVETFSRYGQEFVDKHEGQLGQAAYMGGVAVGVMRALLECDGCPGTFRRPLDADWLRLYCPSCQGVWVRKAS